MPIKRSTSMMSKSSIRTAVNDTGLRPGKRPPWDTKGRLEDVERAFDHVQNQLVVKEDQRDQLSDLVLHELEEQLERFSQINQAQKDRLEHFERIIRRGDIDQMVAHQHHQIIEIRKKQRKELEEMMLPYEARVREMRREIIREEDGDCGDHCGMTEVGFCDPWELI
ncbi:Kinesin-like protein klpA [Neolecta irregularis DAH-3]|uniref:Kinesin-like protein klpA n=1 Tax=Neolecta irregularis (strain DAH-3) TaxID=1198029 RepID=A0A1U7LSU8_NEOID|nr:Kinesin-like protein klpA [Neolecta irregularis DAH-3]|eukprot:OLL25737.1 Kinesin-like protein klpA [Neolecta irregularis DAH-3]